MKVNLKAYAYAYTYAYVYAYAYARSYSYDNYQKPKQKLLNAKINKLWDDYKAGNILPYTLVKKAATILDPVIPTAVQNGIM